MDEDELRFNSWLTSVNSQLGRYTARLLTEADPLSTTEYTTPLHVVEQQLGAALIELGHTVTDKAAGLPITVDVPGWSGAQQSAVSSQPSRSRSLSAGPGARLFSSWWTHVTHSSGKQWSGTCVQRR